MLDRTHDDEAPPSSKKAKPDPNLLIKETRPFFSPSSLFQSTSIFASSNQQNKIFAGQLQTASLFPQSTPFYFGPRPDMTCGTLTVPSDANVADKIGMSEVVSVASTRPSGRVTAKRSSNNVSTSCQTKKQHQERSIEPMVLREQGRPSMFFQSTNIVTNNVFALFERPQKVCSGSNINRDEGGDGVMEDSVEASHKWHPVAVQRVSEPRFTQPFVDQGMHDKGIPIPVQPRGHLSRPCAFNSDSLLTSLQEPTLVEYYPTVETPCNSPTGKVGRSIYPVCPNQVSQSLSIVHDDIRLMGDTDDED